ncbi:hypothetical protein MCOR06_004986 [Pyricularia oryzae]|nr:hypothetical protein MCOR06_004986 [Pyricularia oryzae]
MQAATPRGSTREVAEKYEHLMVPGYSNWPSPEDTTDNLLMPFRGFGDKCQIRDVVSTIWRITGSVAATSLIYRPCTHVMQAFGVPMTGAMLMEQEQMVVAWGRNPDLPRKLLVAMAPTEHNLKSLELDEQKRDSISKLNCNAIWAGIESSHLLGNGTLYSIRASAAAANYLELPKSPFTARFDYFGRGKYFRIMVITNAAITSEETQGPVQ